MEASNELILKSLTKIDNKLDKHDENFAEINKTLTKLIAVDLEIRELRKSTGRAFDRLEVVEKTQNSNGCIALQKHEDVAIEQIKRYDDIVSRYAKRLECLEANIEEIKSIPNKLMMRFGVALAGAYGSWFFIHNLIEGTK